MSRFAVWLASSVLLSSLPLVAASCGPADDPRQPLVILSPDSGTKTKDSGTSDTYVPPDTFDSGGGTQSGRVYAHTADTLYLFEPIKRTLTKIGTFSCLDQGDSMIDIALDRTGAMYGTTYYNFVSIDPTSATCTTIKKASYLSYPNSLSFVPAGTVDPTKEALVGYLYDNDNLATKYVRIDTATGAVTTLGTLNPPNATTKYASSGDFVSLIQDSNKNYLTIRYQTVPDGGLDTDLLAEVDPKTGTITRIVGDTKHEDLYGLGYWLGKAYGFSGDGRVVEISTTNGAATVVASLQGNGGLVWYGAGVTTQAPVSR